MKPETIDSTFVLERAVYVMQQLEHRTAQLSTTSTAGLVLDTEDNPANLIAVLREGIRFAEQVEIPDERTDMFISSHPAMSAIQAAIEVTPPNITPSAFADFAADYLRALFRPREGFRMYSDLQGSVLSIPDTCQIVLVGDFGTASHGAQEVARQIRSPEPNHIIHLGDVYPLGSRTLVDRHFIDVWTSHGPRNMFETNDGNHTRYWALNGNHEMHDRGRGYFTRLLPWCHQNASYFGIYNRYWRLLGIDTAYKDHDIFPIQNEWLKYHLTAGPQANILLSHHQLFSAYDDRPRKSNLPATVRELGLCDHVFAWFWGHEHACVIYEEAPEWEHIRGRCVGHGGKAVTIEHFSSATEPAPPVVARFTVPRTSEGGPIRNGFVLLELEGPRMRVRYIDETGDDTGMPREEWISPVS